MFCLAKRYKPPSTNNASDIKRFPTQPAPTNSTSNWHRKPHHSFNPKAKVELQKAKWSEFARELNKIIGWIPPTDKNYSRFTGALISIAKKTIPRGSRKNYIPGWSRRCEQLLSEFTETSDAEIADSLFESLDSARKAAWIESTEGLNFKRNSRKSWSLLRKLGMGTPSTRPNTPVTADQVASRILSVTRVPKDRPHHIKIMHELTALNRENDTTPHRFSDFLLQELSAALTQVKSDGIHPEFILHCRRFNCCIRYCVEERTTSEAHKNHSV